MPRANLLFANDLFDEMFEGLTSHGPDRAMMEMLMGHQFGLGLGGFMMSALSEGRSPGFAMIETMGGPPGNISARMAALLTDRDFGPDDYQMLLQLDTAVAKRGVTPTEKRKHIHVRVATHHDVTDCLICQEKFKSGTSISVLTCKHEFCEECLDHWFAENRTCPVCRKEVDAAPPEPASSRARVSRGGEEQHYQPRIEGQAGGSRFGASTPTSAHHQQPTRLHPRSNLQFNHPQPQPRPTSQSHGRSHDRSPIRDSARAPNLAHHGQETPSVSFSSSRRRYVPTPAPAPTAPQQHHNPPHRQNTAQHSPPRPSSAASLTASRIFGVPNDPPTTSLGSGNANGVGQRNSTSYTSPLTRQSSTRHGYAQASPQASYARIPISPRVRTAAYPTTSFHGGPNSRGGHDARF